MIYDITPIPKPRQTRSDKWKKRPCVLRYRAFSDECRLKIKSLPGSFHVTFIIPMPNSWSKKAKICNDHTLHLHRGDADNYLKSLLDALCDDDSYIADVRVTKVWGYKGAIKIEPLS